MKITFVFLTVVVIVWMCCLIDRSTAEMDRRTGRNLLQLSVDRIPTMPKHLRVTTILNNPFMMKKDQTNRMPEIKYEGFIVDMLDLLSKRLNFTYQITPVADGKYGMQDSEGTWHGMIGELTSKEPVADIAAADLTITAARKQAVDFTNPFMTSGIGILMKKPEAPTMNTVFLMPFESEVWISGIVAFSVMSAVLFLMARVSSNEWLSTPTSSGTYQRHNNLNFCNSLFFSIGSLTQRGSNVAPRAIATRILSVTWWIFSFFFVACYIANLAAILVHQLETSARGAAIQSVEDLERQTSVKYGTIRGGSTNAFFKNSQVETYQRMYAFMESTSPSPYVKSYADGVEKVKQGGYALFAESSSIDYLTERNCDLMQVGTLLDYRGFGIAMRKGSAMLHDFTVALLELQDKGQLLLLKAKWWGLEEGSCKTQPRKSDSRGALAMDSMSGLFIILILGSILAVIIGIVELFWKAKQTTKEEGGSVCDEVTRELKFGLCGGNPKNAPGQGDGIILQRQDHM